MGRDMKEAFSKQVLASLVLRLMVGPIHLRTVHAPESHFRMSHLPLFPIKTARAVLLLPSHHRLILRHIPILLHNL